MYHPSSQYWDKVLSAAVYKARAKIHHYVSETDTTMSADPTPKIPALCRIKILFNLKMYQIFASHYKAIYYFILKDRLDVKVSNKPEMNQEFKSASKGY